MRTSARKGVVILGSLGVAVGAVACCCVSPGSAVRFGGQSNIIIWNPKLGIEHFVRNAKFHTDNKDMGFIAPTPSLPQLSEASDRAFGLLASLRPVSPVAADFARVATASAGVAKVEVLQEKDVAGYHATTVRANDGRSLADWMRKNNYHSSPTIQRWTEFYVAKKWYLTLFKVQGDGNRGETGTVRLSFKTDKPFNPYYVPQDNIDQRSGAGLTLFFVSDHRYDATIGATEPWKVESWSAPVPDETRSRLADLLRIPESDVPEGATVQRFDDGAFPRPAEDDLYFKPIESSGAGSYGMFGIPLLAAAAFGVWRKKRSKR
jgi:hypothetical protein